MTDDRSSPPRSLSPRQEEFLPFDCTELTKSLIDYARTYLNETEENKRIGLEKVKEFLKNEMGVNMEGPELAYLCFLRSRKYDVKRTCSLIKRGLEFIDHNRSIFIRTESDAVRRTIESKVIGFLPYRDAKGRAIILIRAECWNPSEQNAEDVIYGCIVSLHIAAENALNQVAGFVVIIDFKNLSIHQVIGMSNWVLFGLQAMQKCCPCMVKEFHIVHTPIIIRSLWKIVKPWLSEKIKKRITFYKSTHWDSFHRKIDPRILPEELGGQLGPFSYEHWASDISKIEEKYNYKIYLFHNKHKNEVITEM